LPIKIDIIKHPREIPGKSTAIHAAIIAPVDVKIYTYPDFPEIPNKEEVRKNNDNLFSNPSILNWFLTRWMLLSDCFSFSWQR